MEEKLSIIYLIIAHQYTDTTIKMAVELPCPRCEIFIQDYVLDSSIFEPGFQYRKKIEIRELTYQCETREYSHDRLRLYP